MLKCYVSSLICTHCFDERPPTSHPHQTPIPTPPPSNPTFSSLIQRHDLKSSQHHRSPNPPPPLRPSPHCFSAMISTLTVQDNGPHSPVLLQSALLLYHLRLSLTLTVPRDNGIPTRTPFWFSTIDNISAKLTVQEIFLLFEK